MGFAPVPTAGAGLLFQVFSWCCESVAISVSINPPVDEGARVFGSERLTHPVLTTWNSTALGN